MIHTAENWAQSVYNKRENNTTVEGDHNHLLPREPIHHSPAVTFEVTADDFDSSNDGVEKEYTAERIPSGNRDSSNLGRVGIQGPLEVFCCIEGLVGTSEHLCAAPHVCVVRQPEGQIDQVGCQGCAGALGHGRKRLRPSLDMHIHVSNCLHLITLPQRCTYHGSEPPKYPPPTIFLDMT